MRLCGGGAGANDPPCIRFCAAASPVIEISSSDLIELSNSARRIFCRAAGCVTRVTGKYRLFFEFCYKREFLIVLGRERKVKLA